MNALSEVEILLVEDNPDDAEITLRALGKHNLSNRVEWVKDGEQALQFIFGAGESPVPGRVPRVILLDLRLPKVDGLEVLEKLRSHEITREIPVVVLTSSTQEEDIARCYALGANSFVSKPVTFEAFSGEVAKLGMYWRLLVSKRPLNE